MWSFSLHDSRDSIVIGTEPFSVDWGTYEEKKMVEEKSQWKNFLPLWTLNTLSLTCQRIYVSSIVFEETDEIFISMEQVKHEKEIVVAAGSVRLRFQIEY